MGFQESEVWLIRADDYLEANNVVAMTKSAQHSVIQDIFER